MAGARPRVYVSIVSWRGMHDAAAAIATALNGVLDGVTVIYSNPTGAEETGPGQWIGADEADFFGRKFRALASGVPPGGAMLLIQADAGCDDWPALARRWAAVLARHPQIGVWSPQIDHSAYPFGLTARRLWPEGDLFDVVQTDGIVLGLAPAVLDRLRGLDYSANNLGWGIDWAAVTYCSLNGLSVVGDPTVQVSHPVSRGYEGEAAGTQMEAFLAQLAPAEAEVRARVLRDLRLRNAERGRRHHLTVSAYQRALAEGAAAEAVDLPRLGAAVAGLVLVAGRLLVAPRPETAEALALTVDGQPTPLRPVPPGAIPRILALGGGEEPMFTVTGQTWSCPGQATVSLAFPPDTPTRRVALSPPVDLPPEAGDVTLLVGLAVHRGYGDLMVAWHDRDDPAARQEHFVKFDPAFAGTLAEGDFQAVRLRIPASAGHRIVTLTLCVWPVDRPEREPLVFLLTAPLLVPTDLAESAPVPLVATGGVGVGPALAWHEARIPAGAAAVDLTVNGERLPVLHRAATPAILRRGASGGIEALAQRPCPALLCLDGRPTRLLTLGPFAQGLDLPRHGAGQGVTLRDPTGSLTVASLAAAV